MPELNYPRGWITRFKLTSMGITTTTRWERQTKKLKGESWFSLSVVFPISFVYRNLGRQIWNFSTHCSANNKPHGVLGNSSPWWKPTAKWQMGATSSEMISISSEYRPQTYRFFLVKAGHWQINGCIFFDLCLKLTVNLDQNYQRFTLNTVALKGNQCCFFDQWQMWKLFAVNVTQWKYF